MASRASRILAVVLAAAPLASFAQAGDALRIAPAWQPGERKTYVVQQVVKERGGERETTRFLSNGTLDIQVLDATPEAVTLTWHRRMDNAEMELVREPWGVRGNGPYERLLSSTVKEGLPVTVKLDMRTRRLRIENREELVAALSRRLQTIDPDNLAARRRSPAPGDRNSREPSNAALGIHQPLVRHDATKYAAAPRSGAAVAAWYGRITAAEIEDFFAFLARDLGREGAAPTSAGTTASYRAAGDNLVLVTMARAAAREAALSAPAEGDEGERAVGLAGGELLPVAHEAKIEVTLPSGWPKRAAIVHAEDGGSGTQRTTLRRVYLQQ